MPSVSRDYKPDHGQSRAVPTQARSQASRNAIMQAALALWRTKGFADTTVTDICKAAGVSKALFYVYFSRREDVLLAVEVFTVHHAQLAAETVLARPYELVELIAAVIGPLESQMRNYPPELVFETILETYRLERRALADGTAQDQLTVLFLTPFQQAQRDGKLPARTDVTRAARIAQTLLTDSIRRWAASDFGSEPLTEPLAREIAELVLGVNH
ncbi:TetR/AcrR family transcriptional regulator [Nocardia jiangxiensis]|uniref:TetR/AcrR family transcriptional regulator n=1 Tax=Nocardia jiangxiensis TaxID=282685 RepID=A0ABW6RUX1_9NOCA|nr:TetR/AcrR family transcriptional regulator [Nocardia jiangxiensis]